MLSMGVHQGCRDGSGEACIVGHAESLTEPRTKLAAMFSILHYWWRNHRVTRTSSPGFAAT